MTDAHIIEAEKVWDKRCEESDMNEEKNRVNTINAIKDNYLDVEILTESDLTNDENWKAFLNVIVRHAEGKLTTTDKVLMMDKILDSAFKYASEVVEREAE